MSHPSYKLNKPVYQVYFRHVRTGDTMMYKFMSYDTALSFIERLDPVKCCPTLYEKVRIQ